MESQQHPVKRSIQPEEIPDTADPRTEREMSALKTQALSAESQRNEHNRNEKLRNVIAWGVWGLLSVIFILVAIALLILAWHYLGPEDRKWMSDENRMFVGAILSSGTISAFLGHYLRIRI